MQEFYKIRQIACLFGISCDTLRLYEKTGLFQPAYTDEKTKYRYYGINEILKLDYIIQLKNIGFTLSEIKKILCTGIDMPKKRQVLETRYHYLRELLSVYDGLMNDGEFDIEQKKYPAHYAMTKQVTVKNWQELIGTYIDLTNQIISDKCTFKPFSYPYARFEGGFSFQDFSCTVCMELEDTLCKNAIYYPEQTFLCIKYKGDYDGLDKAYQRLYTYAEENGIILLPYAIERYIVAYDNSPMSSNFITEINLPLAETNCKLKQKDQA